MTTGVREAWKSKQQGGHFRRIGLFGAVGVAVMLVGAVTLFIGVEVLGLPLWVAYALQVIIAFNLSFLLNDRFTWGDRRLHGASTMRHRWLLFAGGRAVSIAATTAMFAAIASYLPYLVAHFLSIGLVAVGNYIFNDVVVFRSPKPTKSSWFDEWAVWEGRPAKSVETPWKFDLSVVLPVKGNENTVGDTVESILRQDFDGEIQLLVVIDREDPGHRALKARLGADQVIQYVHPDPSFPLDGRDANYRRALGVQASDAPVVAMVDADMIYPPNWARTGLSILDARPEIGVVLGTVESARPERFWQSYVDNNTLGSKTPRWEKETIIDVTNFGVGDAKPGITANLFVRTSVLAKSGLPRPDFVYTYDDYAFLFDIVKSGELLLCTPQLTGRHFHRDHLRELFGEYVSAGQGCGDFVWSYPRSSFATKRITQLFAVLGGGLAVLAGLLIDWQAVLMGSLVVAGMLGVWSAASQRDWRGVVHPLATLVLGLGFSYGLIRGLLRGGPPTVLDLDAIGGELSSESDGVDREPASATAPKAP